MIRQILLIINILIFTPFFPSLIIIIGIFDTKKIYTSKLAKLWATTILILSNIKYSIDGIDKINRKKKYIIISNHQSLLDILVTFSLIPLNISFFTKKELFYIPIFGTAMKLAGMIYVDRYNISTSKDCVDNTLYKINKTHLSYLIYPEATRTYYKSLEKFKKGGFILALESSLSILPITVIYNEKKLINSRIRLVVGNTINTLNYDTSYKDNLITKTQNIIKSELYKEFN